MTLQKQLLPLALIGGLNESEDALVSNHPQQMTNCRYRKSPAVSKRNGYDCIAPYNLHVNGGTPPTPEKLTPYGNELVRIGGGQLSTFGIVNATSDWAFRGLVPEVLVKQDVASAAAAVSASQYANPSTAYANGYLVTAYLMTDGTTYRILCDVVNATTGAHVFSQQQMFSLAGGLYKPVVVAFGTTVGIFWANNGAFTIQGRFLDTVTMQFAASAVVVGIVSAGGLKSFDVDAVSATEWVVVYEINAGVNRLSYRSFSPTIAFGSYTTLTSGVLNTTDIGVQVFSIRAVPGLRLFVTYAWDNGAGTTFIKGATQVLPGYAEETAPATISSYATDSTVALGVEITSSTTAIVAWSRASGSTSWREFDNIIVVSGAAKTLLNAFLMSRPLVRGGAAYAAIIPQNGVRRSQFLIDLHKGVTLPLGGSPRIVAAFLPDQLPPTVRPRELSVASWSAVSGSAYVLPTLVQGVKAHALAITALRFDFSTFPRMVTNLPSLLAIGGGALSFYDGVQVFEAGFAHAPDATAIGHTPSNAGGSLTVSSTYGHKLIYAWPDARGGWHRSAPSDAVQTVTGAADNRIVLSLPYLQLTNKDANVSGTSMVVEVYRTLANGATYYYVGAVPNVPGTVGVTFNDTLSDVAISTAATLYTTGGVLPHTMPAGGNLLLAWKGALLVAGVDDDSVWISGEVLPNEGPWFNSTMNVPAFEGGQVSALATLDATPIVFKADSAFYLDGEPPTDLGVSSIGAPRRIQTEAGCTDINSIVTSKYGLARMARSGIFILNSSLTDAYLGRSVEDSYRTAGFAGAEILPAQGLVRWLQKGTGGADALNWDFIHSEDFGAPSWSKDTLTDVQTFGAPVGNPVACCVYQGAFVWASTSGYVYRENTAVFSDTNYAGSTRSWIPMTFEASVAKPFGVGGWARVWRVIVTGLRRSAHNMTLTVTTDSSTTSWSWTDAEIQAMGGLPDERFMAHVADQKCSWMRVKWADAIPTSPAGGYGNFEGMMLRDISLEIGQKPAGARFRAANRK